ncbi:MAG: preprotein translocase subunit YajC [Lachnospiraceae bacterium]|nr:preprotein translocase subunit YajC [Lachnospiraceae bacterium]MDD3795565.1 preprotein translocase subunit YajC [Lachnospiraceae bacterium]
MNLLTEAASSAGAGGGMMLMVVYIAIIGGAMYFFAIRPQKKEQKRLTALLSSMEVGDTVVTTSGFYGVIIDITDEDCIVEFGSNKNCRIPMRKTAIAEVEKANAGIE